MVSFRLSPEEFQIFQNACGAQGARNLSELARTAMQKLVASVPPAGEPSEELLDLKGEVHRISQVLDQITRRLDGETS